MMPGFCFPRAPYSQSTMFLRFSVPKILVPWVFCTQDPLSPLVLCPKGPKSYMFFSSVFDKPSVTWLFCQPYVKKLTLYKVGAGCTLINSHNPVWTVLKKTGWKTTKVKQTDVFVQPPQSDCHLTSAASDQDQKHTADESDVITQRAFQLSESSSG